MRLAQFERDAEDFSSAVNRAQYLQGAGLKSTLDLDDVFARYGHLFRAETFHELREATLEDGRDEQYRRFLLEFVASSYLRNAVRAQTERLAEAEATTVLDWRERTISFRSVPVVVANMPEHAERHALDAAWRGAVDHLNGVRETRLLEQHERAADLGYPGYVELWEQLRALRLEWLTVQVLLLLSSTEQVYRDQLTRLLNQHGLRYGGARKADLGWVFRAKHLDDVFTPRLLLPIVHATLRELGYRLEDQKNIRLDLEPRPAKTPRAFCAPIQVPQDIRLVFRSVGGRNDYETLLHELGHAQHFAGIDPTLSFGYRRLGDGSLTEGYAFLLQYLTTDRYWWSRHLQRDAEGYLHLSLLHKLSMLRRYATKVLYEVELHRVTDDLGPLRERYVELFSGNLGVQYGPEEFLSDVDDGFYAVVYLRAWMFEAQLRAYLKREFDEEWFRMPKAGRFVRDLWREGQRHTAEALVGFMGYDDLSIEPLLAEVRDVLER